MYLSKIELENIKCFDRLTIDIKNKEDIVLWVTILGNNAVGKSTILRSIAMGLCDEASAAALMKEMKGEFLRKGTLKGYIKLTLEGKGKSITITTELTKSLIDEPVKLTQTISDGSAPWNELFFCGYGASIPGGGGEGFEKYKPLEAVYTLFNYSSELQNPEVIMLRQEQNFREWLDKKLLSILMLENHKIIYNKKGMYLSGPWGEFRLDELSDGYKMMSLKIYEIFGWAILADIFNKAGDEIEGILLLDEIETHLHPNWQRSIVDRLKTQFPKIQFITTTHSPFVALGTADLENALMLELDIDLLDAISANSKTVVATEYKGLTADQILTSPPFDLPIPRSVQTGDIIIRFQELLLKEKLNSDEKVEFRNLQVMIKELPDVFETMENLRIHKKIQELLEKDSNDSN